MAEDNNRDSFDEFLNRAEEDYEAEQEDDDILKDVEDEAEEDAEEDEDDFAGASRSGSIVSEEMRARSLMADMPTAHGEIGEGANGGDGTIVRRAYHERHRLARPARRA